MTFYSFAKFVVSVVLKPLYRIQIEGTENIPKEGAVLLCANHIDNLDPPIVGITSPRTVHFMAKEEVFRVPVLKTILPKVHAFPVKRGMSDREALRNALKVLKQGNVLGLFPEGTRSKTGELGKGLAGAGFFALRSESFVVPCAIIGPYKLFKPIRVIYGKPIDFTQYRVNKVSAEEATLIIMDSIREIIEKNK
ncbi:lysophospholipid acyltransferase family protein [Sutcliffiella rhizosphaerae]|uniref:1-acyl-sn-glycerol-3-phosphate acyltransferase n=1 Tax=Sutcliffiella rhizosphaerae TaxID=2880967 RepID=A0ABM8YU69_9BACI|nr:lysophospholipid acyltransferase family protein [Sutcliffiella rhizosphaerae]CAG9623515.1 1-acyl-sn-glycerol-3-phosphate acyltransferase [Sutcliffiella rhizosphaerae]